MLVILFGIRFRNRNRELLKNDEGAVPSVRIQSTGHMSLGVTDEISLVSSFCILAFYLFVQLCLLYIDG